MEKNFLNLGKVLSKTEQKTISGGNPAPIYCDGQVCPSGICVLGSCCW